MAKLLSDWTGAEFQRIPQSGGLRWRNTMNICGDLLCTEKHFYFPFAVETKHLAKITVEHDLRSNSHIYTIYRQAKRDADRAAKFPMMILRGNREKDYTVFFESHVPLLQFLKQYKIKIVSFGTGIIGIKAKDLWSINYSTFVNCAFARTKDYASAVTETGGINLNL